MNIVAAGYVTPDPNPKGAIDQSAGFNDAAAATSYWELPEGTYGLNPGKLTIGARQNMLIKGVGGRVGPAYLENGAKLVVLNDDKTQQPHTLAAIDLGQVARAEVYGVSIKLQSIYAAKNGCIGNHVVPIRFGASAKWDDFSVEGGSSSVCVGGVDGGVGEGFDHSEYGSAYLGSGGAGYALNFEPGSISAGDDRMRAMDLFGQCASIAIAQSASSGIVGSNVEGLGMYANGVSIFRYRDGSNAAGGLFQSNVLNNVSGEFAQDAVFFDECAWDKVGGVQFGWNNWGQGFYLCPRPYGGGANGWGATASVTGYMVDANGVAWLTVSVPPGFDFRDCGMTVDNLSGQVTQIKFGSIEGAWLDHVTAYNSTPGATTMSVTFALNAPFTTAPTQVHVNMPKLGAVVARQIFNETVRGRLMRNPSAPGYPVFYAASASHDVFIEDGQTALAMAQAGGLFGGLVEAGCRWGVGTVTGVSGMLGPGRAGMVGDLVMNPDEGTMNMFDGSDEPVGVLVRAANPGQNVDAQSRGADRTSPAPWRNLTTATVAPYALLAADDQNPGGMRPAKNAYDGIICGRNGASAVAPGATGVTSRLNIR